MVVVLASWSVTLCVAVLFLRADQELIIIE